VNGPGEAREADVGIAGGANELLLFVHGESVSTTGDEDAVDALLGRLSTAT
jgi:(E)-4-hydroxy-3-methylbut-2-enyl-diphosphate synthase